MNVITGYILEFISENKLWVFITIVITLICNPIEMIWLSDLFTQFTIAIDNLQYAKLLSILWKMTAVYIFIDLANMVSNYFDKIYYPKLEKFIRFKLIDIIFNHIDANYEKEDISNHIVKALKVPNSVTAFTSLFVYWIVTFILTTVLIIGYIFWVSPTVGAMTTLVFAVYFIVYYTTLHKTMTTSEQREHQENTLLSEIDDILGNSISIISTRKVDDEKEYLTERHDIYDAVHEDHLWHNSKTGFILSVVGTLLLVFYVYMILTLYRNKQLNNADTIKLIIIILFFVRYVKLVSHESIYVVTEYGKLVDSERNIQTLLRYDTDNSSRLRVDAVSAATAAAASGAKTGIPITGDIEFKNVSFGYPGSGTGAVVKSLDNVSFKIHPRESVAIIGTNGSGKSTIIKLMCGYFGPTEGQILFDGVDLREIDREHLRSNISMVSQKVVLFNRTVLENICYGTNIPKEQVVPVLDRLQITSVFHKLPQGLDTMAGARGEKLSGGQRQIIYLLRSYLSNKPITIMDEPTAAVDAFHKKYVIQMMNEMSKKTTMIVVTHDSEFAASFHKKIYIEGGRIMKVEGGSSSSSYPFSYT
jgi:ATP-binding cassette, subfamily B, bacterial